MSKQFLAIIAAIVLVFAGIAVFSGKDEAKVVSSATPTSHVKGAGTEDVTLLEYADFECQFCLQYYPTLKQVVAEYGDKIKFQFRHYPLTSIHQNAFAAARAAEAAGMQGKFFEMHDLLYEDRSWVGSSTPTAVFESFAERLELDTAKYKQDFASTSVNNIINADLAAGQKLDVTGTPTYFLNGKKVTINNTLDDFKKVIDAEIAKSN